MTKRNTGGPAFPQPINPLEYGRGMTLRDYFAAKAMQALVSLSGNMNDEENAWNAKAAYKMADAMLSARES